MTPADEFDWGDNEAVTLRSYGAIAVYENPHGSIVLRQQRDALEEEDSTVIIPLPDVELVAAEILSVAKAAREATEEERVKQKKAPGVKAPCLALLPAPGVKSGR